MLFYLLVELKSLVVIYDEEAMNSLLFILNCLLVQAVAVEAFDHSFAIVSWPSYFSLFCWCFLAPNISVLNLLGF
jgi:hypothetical protein